MTRCFGNRPDHQILSEASVLVLVLFPAGYQSKVQGFHEAVDVSEGVVQRHRSNSQDLWLPHVTLTHTTHISPGVSRLKVN